MKTKHLETYIRPLLDANIPNLRHIRIGSKALAYWPYRFITDDDADDLLALFEDVKRAGKHLAFMAHFNHPVAVSYTHLRISFFNNWSGFFGRFKFQIRKTGSDESI